jgi:hypothetical protein
MKPDYNVEETFEDYKNGIDQILNLLKITNNYERFPSKQIMTMPK